MRQQIILLPPWRRSLPPPPLPYGASWRQLQWQLGQLQPAAVAAGVSCSQLQWRPGSAAVSCSGGRGQLQSATVAGGGEGQGQYLR